MFNSQFDTPLKNFRRGFSICLLLISLTACGSKGGDGPKNSLEAKFSLENQSLDFGKVTTELSFKVQNSGNTDLSWTTATSANWLTITPANNTLPASTQQVVTVRVDRSKLSSGENTATVTVSAKQGDTNLANSPATITVKARK